MSRATKTCLSSITFVTVSPDNGSSTRSEIENCKAGDLVLDPRPVGMKPLLLDCKIKNRGAFFCKPILVFAFCASVMETPEQCPYKGPWADICPHGIREGLPKKKVAVLLDFVQITSTPPPFPLIWTTCTTFF